MQTRDYENSNAAISKAVSHALGISNVKIERNENGKPYLKELPYFLSVSHTGDKTFIALSDENVGIDAELCSRQCEYLPIIKKFSVEERAEIFNLNDFLAHWVVKESAVKWLGGTLAKDLYKLRYEKGELYYGEIRLPVKIALLRFGEYLVGVCGERDFSTAQAITI